MQKHGLKHHSFIHISPEYPWPSIALPCRIVAKHTMHSLIHSFIHSFHQFIHSFHPFIHLFTHSFIHSLIHSFIHFTNSSIHSFIHFTNSLFCISSAEFHHDTNNPNQSLSVRQRGSVTYVAWGTQWERWEEHVCGRVYLHGDTVGFACLHVPEGNWWIDEFGGLGLWGIQTRIRDQTIWCNNW